MNSIEEMDDIEKVKAYFEQRMRALEHIFRQDESPMIAKNYVIEKLRSIQTGGFELHPSVEERTFGTNADWISNYEYQQVKHRIEVMNKL